MERSYHLVVLGCQMNVHDAEKIAGMLETMGYRHTGEPEQADVLLYITCCVRENPERKIFGQLDNLRRVKDQRPEMVIGVCGCMVQQPYIFNKIRDEYPQVNLVFGTHNLHQLPGLLQRVTQHRERVLEVWDEPGESIPEGVPVRRESRLKAFVSVTYGCDNFCTYCIVPYVRGRCRSRQFNLIVEEVAILAADGCREVTLLGQNVNAYGKDLPEKRTFAELLWALNDIPGLERIRFTTSHPKDLSPDLIEAMARAGKVCEHLHLPLQAGSDRILKAMGRGYTASDYLSLVGRLREQVPQVALTTDVMVGFPGETEEDFLGTVEVMERVQYDAAFTFIYSPREGTPGARMKDQVPEEVKKDRIHRLIKIQEELSLKKNQAHLGSIQEVLVEGPSETDPATLSGRSRGNKMVHFSGPAELAGKVVRVRIDKVHSWTLFGEMVGE